MISQVAWRALRLFFCLQRTNSFLYHSQSLPSLCCWCVVQYLLVLYYWQQLKEVLGFLTDLATGFTNSCSWHHKHLWQWEKDRKICCGSLCPWEDIFTYFCYLKLYCLLAACFSLRLFCLMYHNSEVPLLYHCCDGEGKHQYFGSTLGSQTSEKGYKLKYSFVSCLALLWVIQARIGLRIQ